MSDSSKLDVRWMTVSYRSVGVAVALFIVLLIALTLWLVPGLGQHLTSGIAHLFESGTPSSTSNGVTAASHQAHFVNLEGTVQVKSASSPTFTAATLDTVLHAGDTVQTGANGWARIEFAEGTTYLLSPSSLIVVEQQEVTSRSSAVSVQVTSGSVDLSTSNNDRPRAVSKVSFGGAAASLGRNARAQVESGRDQSSMTLIRGSASVAKGRQTVQVRPFEKLSVSGAAPMQVSFVPQTPDLLAPGNLSPVPMHGRQATVNFNWSAVPGASAYDLRLSTSLMFSQLLKSVQLPSTAVAIPNLPAGAYYWTVAAEVHGQRSPWADTNKFTIVKAGGKDALPLKIDKVLQVGMVLEVDGTTAPGAKVLVNNELVGLIEGDGTFHYVTPPYANTGTYTLHVTAEDSSGHITTVDRSVTLQ